MSEKKAYSFELFPPRSQEAEESLRDARHELASKQPSFFSCTYGAGGSTRDKTLSTVLEIHREGHPVAPHLSFNGEDQAQVDQLLATYIDAGINRLVALRGDIPSGMGNMGSMVYANELVAHIREKTGDHFHIEVAAYPEIHPQSTSYETDIHYLKQKFEAGANSAITQYFFNPDAYFHYLDNCLAAGIEQPIVPGIMPITNISNLIRFSDACGADIPRWIRKQMDAYAGDHESSLKFGIEVVTRLCEKLLEGGAPGLHFYTMNRAEPTLTIWDNLNLDSRR
ncbi:MAG: methylenetetrahydrofolate reductase [NAD(P)H] [Pseudomonadales bacterium]